MARFLSSPIFLCPLLLWTGMLCGSPDAGDLDYYSDKVLAETTINISDFRLRQAALSEIFSAIEKQTEFRFVYVASQLPLDATMSFESGDYITLARLFTAISAMVDIALLRHDKKIIVRSHTKDANAGDIRFARAAGDPDIQPKSIA